MFPLLSQINSPQDLKALNPSDFPALANELRQFILETLANNPGHLGASLGVIELTIMLHYFYDTPNDPIIWDVGHQAYAHKILTGRRTNFSSLRQINGISGFPSRDESIYDAFGTGHSSTSISAITGMAFANELSGENKQHIAVIGDASLAAGLAFEGLNHLGNTNLNVLVILNDNNISIDDSVGALKNYLNRDHLASKENFFTDLGFSYLGKIDGHSFSELTKAFEWANVTNGPKFLHLKTIKGRGYDLAEKNQIIWHSPGKFDKDSGELIPSKSAKTFQDVFGETMIDLLNQNQEIIAVSPAMFSGSNLVEAHKKFSKRVVDVGIAEQHAVTFSAGLAAQGKIPYCVIYSTFLQRAYDQLIHDVALQELPVVFCIDRAGIVGGDGATHHGYFDLSFLRSIPNMIVSAPANLKDFKNILYTAQFTNQPFAIRYPKESIPFKDWNQYEKIEIGKGKQVLKGQKIAFLALGPIVSKLTTFIENEVNSDDFGLYDLLFLKPIDKRLVFGIFNQYDKIFTFEDGIGNGGLYDAILELAAEYSYKGKIIGKAYPDAWIGHGSIDELKTEIKFSFNNSQNLR